MNLDQQPLALHSLNRPVLHHLHTVMHTAERDLEFLGMPFDLHTVAAVAAVAMVADQRVPRRNLSKCNLDT